MPTRCFIFGLLLLAATPPAAADQIKANALWLDVDVIGLTGDGQLRYVTGTGKQISRPYDQITSLRLDDYPKLQEGLELIEKREDRLAINVLTTINKPLKRGDAWVVWEATRRIAAARDRLDQGLSAASAYARLLEQKAHPVFLDRPPLASVARLDLSLIHI